jgi:hypothetical protein
VFVAAEAGDVRRNLRQPVRPTQPAELLRAQRPACGARSSLLRAEMRA